MAMQSEGMPFPFRYVLQRLRDVLFGIIFLATLSYGPALFNLDGDLGRHITIGHYILDSKSIPTQDIFSHTMRGEPLVPHEWLAQVIFSLVYSLAGLNGIALLVALIIALTFTLIYQELIRNDVPRLAAFMAVGWCAIASSLHWLARPHIFTFLFLAVWTILLER